MRSTIEWRQSSFSFFFAARSVSTALTSTDPPGADPVVEPGARGGDCPAPAPRFEAGAPPGADCALAWLPKIDDMMLPKMPMAYPPARGPMANNSCAAQRFGVRRSVVGTVAAGLYSTKQSTNN